MTIQEKVNKIRIEHQLNLSLNYYKDDVDSNTDLFVATAIKDFYNKFKNRIIKGSSFIIKYDNDAYSFYAYKIIKNCLINFQVENKIYIMGDLKTEEEKRLFKEETIISQRNAKKKGFTLITGYHPIYNVESDKGISKSFKEVYHPIAIGRKEHLEKLKEYYIPDNSPLENTINNMKEHEVILEKELPFVLIELSGTEKDFKIYDHLLKNFNHEYYICIYCAPHTIAKNFIKLNLGTYINRKNYPSDIRFVDNLSEGMKLVKESNKNWEIPYSTTISYKAYKGDENENSNS